MLEERRGGRPGADDGATPPRICEKGSHAGKATPKPRGCCWCRGGYPALRDIAAKRRGHVDAARLLLDKGAAVDRAAEDGIIAKSKGHSSIVALLSPLQRASMTFKISKARH